MTENQIVFVIVVGGFSLAGAIALMFIKFAERQAKK